MLHTCVCVSLFCVLLAYFLRLKTRTIFLITKTKLLDLEENYNALQGVFGSFCMSV